MDSMGFATTCFYVLFKKQGCLWHAFQAPGGSFLSTDIRMGINMEGRNFSGLFGRALQGMGYCRAGERLFFYGV